MKDEVAVEMGNRLDEMDQGGDFQEEPCMYAKEERIFRFVGDKRTSETEEWLAVPPMNYTAFLTSARENIEKFILEVNGCETLDEVSQRYYQKQKKHMPEPHEELPLTSALSVSTYGKLTYLRSRPRAMRANRVYRSSKYEEYLCPKGKRKWISLDNHEGHIQKFVTSINKKLDNRFPERQHKLTTQALTDRKKEGELSTRQLLWSFDFGLEFFSQPTGLLTTKVSCINYGSISFEGIKSPRYQMPAIRVQSEATLGPRSLVKKSVDVLEEVVRQNYDIGAVAYRVGFEREKYRISD